METLEELWDIVCKIPAGKVMTYGQVGEFLRTRATGYQVGRWMASAPEGVPWWRVIAKNGGLPIAKRGPAMANEQAERLRSEGTPFKSEYCVDIGEALYVPKD